MLILPEIRHGVASQLFGQLLKRPEIRHSVAKLPIERTHALSAIATYPRSFLSRSLKGTLGAGRLSTADGSSTHVLGMDCLNARQQG